MKIFREEVERKSASYHDKNRSDYSGTGNMTIQSVPQHYERLSALSHRTVDLGRYQFARVSIGLDGFVHPEQADEAINAMFNAVYEILAREVHLLNVPEGSSYSRKDTHVDTILGGFDLCGVSLAVDYGMTLSLGKGNGSIKFDVGRTFIKPDDVDFEEFVLECQEWVGHVIEEQQARIREGSLDEVCA